MVRMGSPVRFRRGALHSLTSANAGQFHIWGPVERAMLVLLTFRMAWMGACPDGEHFPGQPFGFWDEPAPMTLSACDACAPMNAWSLPGR
jgi:hypothetical protein